MKSSILSFAIFLACFFVKAGDTNIFYVTDNDHLLDYSSNGKSMMNPELVEAAKKMRECQPAEKFPEGNWGTNTGGFQLSLRFEKQTFTNGEPITAILLIRNVTNDTIYLHFNPFPIGYSDGPIGFQVASKTGGLLSQRQYVAGVWSGTYRWLPAGTQAKYLERLDKRFNLTNGTYTIQALKTASSLPFPEIDNGMPVFKWSLQKNAEIKSAAVTIKIE